LKAGTAGYYVLLLFLIYLFILTFTIRAIISKTAGPILAIF